MRFIVASFGPPLRSRFTRKKNATRLPVGRLLFHTGIPLKMHAGLLRHAAFAWPS
jgi:hypothetical protein